MDKKISVFGTNSRGTFVVAVANLVCVCNERTSGTCRILIVAVEL